MSTSPGACRARARLHARLGSPMPTNTTSPSRSSRAATTVIISLGVYAGTSLRRAAFPLAPAGASVAVVHPCRDPVGDAESFGQLRLGREIGGAVGDPMHEAIQIAGQPSRVSRDGLPGYV